MIKLQSAGQFGEGDIIQRAGDEEVGYYLVCHADTPSGSMNIQSAANIEGRRGAEPWHVVLKAWHAPPGVPMIAVTEDAIRIAAKAAADAIGHGMGEKLENHFRVGFAALVEAQKEQQ